MTTITSVAEFLESLAPARLAAEWDNVGLLVGDARREVTRLMTCLTITPASAAEAIERGAELIVAHHPLPFRPLRRLTTETTAGRLLLDLAAARVAVYSPHTAFDSAAQGVNQRLAAGLGLGAIAPLVPVQELLPSPLAGEGPGVRGQRRHSLPSPLAGEGPGVRGQRRQITKSLSPGRSLPNEQGLGSGRWGLLEPPRALAELAEQVKALLKIERLQLVGEPQQPVRALAVSCGAAGEFLDAARRLGCDAMLLGETSFHTCLEAESRSIGLILPGHFASERFAVECLADVLHVEFPSLEIWPSRRERDPLRWV